MLLKCKMCGGDLEFTESISVVECEYCGTQQTVPKADNEKKMTLFSRANRLRLANEFDKAAGIYESIVAEFPEEAEAYWGLVLCRYGIEYVDDPATGRKVPTCHRSSFDSIMDDSDFEQATENADVVARRVYRDEAKAIEEIRKGILEVSGKENPYDIFICYKEIDENGNRTIDSVIAQDVYDALTEKGYRVFFARISLEDKLGSEYEPYIFAALNSAKVMLVFGTDYEYFSAVWVKNEWSRFLALIASGQKKTLIPCYKDIDAYDMPKEFVKLQGQDMAKIGAIQDLLRGIEKIIGLPVGDEGGMDIPKAISDYEKSRIEEAENNLEQGIMCLEDEEWENAYYYFNEANLGIGQSNPKFTLVYLGRLCAQLEICTIDEFKEGTPALIENNGVKSFKISAQIKAGYYCLENEWWDDADSFFDEAINIDAKCAVAYIGKMMAESEISKESDIFNLFLGRNWDIRENKNYQKALRFADDTYKRQLEEYAPSMPVEDAEIEEELQQVREKIKTFSKLLIANGNNSYALTNYGTVYSIGENKYGQCNTSTWNQIKSIAVGSYHIAGLRNDGTVVSVGAKNELINRGQCHTGDWNDIKQIAVSSSATIGLKSNGSFVVCGDAIENKNKIDRFSVSGYAAGVAKNILGQVLIPKMADYKKVYLGSDDIYGLTSDRRVETINSYDACNNWRDIIDIATSPQVDHVVGLSKTGICFARGGNKYGECNVQNWKDIVAVAVGGNSVCQFTVGLKSNGTVIAVGDNSCGQCKTSSWRNIVAIAAGYYHTVGLKADGTVVAVGGNDEVNPFDDDIFKNNYGQCDTADWQDIVAISAGAYHTVGLKADGTVVAVGSNEHGQCNVQGWVEIGTSNSSRQQEREIAESHRLYLCTLRDEVAQRKEEMKQLRAKLKQDFDSFNICLNCGKKHFGEVTTCKECGAVFESGVGTSGVKFRRYKLDKQGINCKIFRDGYLNLIIAETAGRQKIQRLTDEDLYVEFYSNFADEQDSDVMGIYPDGRFLIAPKEKRGLEQCLFNDGSAKFQYDLSDEPEGKLMVQVVYSGGHFVLEECDEPILKAPVGTSASEVQLNEQSAHSLCPNCKKENKSSAKFCKYCGATMQFFDTAKEVLRTKAEEKRNQLEKTRNAVKERKEDFIKQRTKLKENFSDDKRCLACGKMHFSAVNVCKQCGAINERGVGRRGINFRSITLKDIGKKISLCQDDWIDSYQTNQSGEIYWVQLDNKEQYHEQTTNADYVRISERLDISPDGTFLVWPVNGNGIVREMKSDRIALFYHVMDGQLHGTYELVRPGGIATFSEYKNGQKIYEGPTPLSTSDERWAD